MAGDEWGMRTYVGDILETMSLARGVMWEASEGNWEQTVTLYKEPWRKSHSWRNCGRGTQVKELWRRSHGRIVEELVKEPLESLRETKQEEYRMRQILKGEASKRGPGRGIHGRESGNSRPGAGLRKRTQNKSLRRGIMFWRIRVAPGRHPGGTRGFPGSTQEKPEAPRRPTRRHPEAPRPRSHPGGTQEPRRRHQKMSQEHPGRTRGHLGHRRGLWCKVCQNQFVLPSKVPQQTLLRRRKRPDLH